MSKQLHRTWLSAGVLVVLMYGLLNCPITAASPKAKDSAKDSVEKKLNGSWKMVEIEARGEKTKPPIEMVFTFKEDSVEQKFGERSQTSKCKYDPDHPAHLDVIRERGGESRVFKMIFSIEGDTLKMCSGRPGAERPTKFTSEDGYSIQVLQRVKP